MRLAAALAAASLAAASATTTTAPAPRTRVTFGSCNRADEPQPLWPHVTASAPDAWIWAGDNVYGDTVRGFDVRTGSIMAQAATPAGLRALYDRQRREPGYAALARSNATILGTWDDHDFGLNDGDRTYAHRKESQKQLLDFLGEPPLSARRRRSGVYTAARIAPPRAAAARGAQGVLVLLLDVRYHKDPYPSALPSAGDMLGEAQWRWLDAQLARSKARVTIIVGGLQVLPGRGIGEGWARFPEARARLLRMLHDRGARGVVLLSGDVHFAELNLARCDLGGDIASPGPAAGPGPGPGPGPAGDTTQVVELTSSGLTHAWGHRPLPGLLHGPVSDWLYSFLFHAAMATMPWRYQARGDGAGRGRGHGPGYYVRRNFGRVDVRWDDPGDPLVTLAVVGEHGDDVIQRSWRASELDLRPPPATGPGAVPNGMARRTLACRPHRGGAEAPSLMALGVGALVFLALLSYTLLVIAAVTAVLLAGVRHAASRVMLPPKAREAAAAHASGAVGSPARAKGIGFKNGARCGQC